MSRPCQWQARRRVPDAATRVRANARRTRVVAANAQREMARVWPSEAKRKHHAPATDSCAIVWLQSRNPRRLRLNWPGSFKRPEVGVLATADMNIACEQVTFTSLIAGRHGASVERQKNVRQKDDRLAVSLKVPGARILGTDVHRGPDIGDSPLAHPQATKHKARATAQSRWLTSSSPAVLQSVSITPRT